MTAEERLKEFYQSCEEMRDGLNRQQLPLHKPLVLISPEAIDLIADLVVERLKK